MQSKDKIVAFHEYCYKCKHRDLYGYEEPCNECLNNPTNVNSRKPVKYEEDEKKVNKK